MKERAFSDRRARVQDVRGKGGDDKHLDRETIVSRGASARGKERAHGVADSDVDGVASVCCARACATERGGRESEGTQAARRCGNGKRRERVACEGKPARSGGDDVDDGRIIHSAAQKKGEERVLCVCVCACATERRQDL